MSSLCQKSAWLWARVVTGGHGQKGHSEPQDLKGVCPRQVEQVVRLEQAHKCYTYTKVMVVLAELLNINVSGFETLSEKGAPTMLRFLLAST